MDRVMFLMFLMDLLKERLKWFLEDKAAYDVWKKDNPGAYYSEYPGKFRVTKEEIKRLSLVLRQEMIRFEKTL